MKIKSYRAESMAEALKSIRTEMGPDAFLLKTRKLTNAPSNERFEVTACVAVDPADKPSACQNGNAHHRIQDKLPDESMAPVPNTVVLNGNGDDGVKEKLESIEKKLTTIINQSRHQHGCESMREITARLKDADCTDIDIHQLIAKPNQATNDNGSIVFGEAINAGLTNLLTQLIAPRLNFRHGDKVVVFGPAGCGKTSFVGKLTALLLLQYKVKVSPDRWGDAEVGLMEILAGKSDLMSLYDSCGGGKNKKEAAYAKAVAVIDTPPLPQNRVSLENLQNRIQDLQPTHRFFVFSALMRNTDLQEMMESVRSFRPTHLVMTMADLTNRYGALLSAAKILACPLAFITDSPSGFGEIKTPEPGELARRILNLKEGMCKC